MSEFPLEIWANMWTVFVFGFEKLSVWTHMLTLQQYKNDDVHTLHTASEENEGRRESPFINKVARCCNEITSLLRTHCVYIEFIQNDQREAITWTSLKYKMKYEGLAWTIERIPFLFTQLRISVELLCDAWKMDTKWHQTKEIAHSGLNH